MFPKIPQKTRQLQKLICKKNNFNSILIFNFFFDEANQSRHNRLSWGLPELGQLTVP
jgi:hypothetical protein